MKYNDTKFVAAVSRAIADVCPDKPTEGRGCAVAGIRTIRDGLLDTLVSADGSKQLFGKATPEVAAWLKAEMLELLKEVAKDGARSGFLSNASAAAKAAGFHAPERKEVVLSD